MSQNTQVILIGLKKYLLRRGGCTCDPRDKARRSFFYCRENHKTWKGG
jgi:hypothetical protein